MMKRTTVLLEGEVYNALVRESLQEYKNAKSISKVMNKILKRALTSEARLTKLLYSKKVAYTTAKEFEKFRHDLSESVISR
jgi:hypothetical protein